MNQLTKKNSMNENHKQYQKITSTSLAKIKDVSLSDIILQFVKLKKQGANFKGSCPFHNEKTPSFSVSDSKNIYKCFGCGASGDGIRFIREYEKKTFVEACETIASLSAIQIEFEEKEYSEKEKQIFAAAQLQEDVLNYVIPTYRSKLFDLPAEHPVKEYLYKRGCTDEIILEWQLGWAGTDWHYITPQLIKKDWFEPASKLGIIKRNKEDRYYDVYRSRITIPITDKNGKYIGLAGRFIEVEDADKEKSFPKYINSTDCELYNKSKILFGLNRAAKAIKESKIVVLVEGYFDVISLYPKMQNVVASCGTALTIEQMDILKKFTNHIHIMPDNDEAGQKSFNKNLPELLSKGFRVDIVEYDELFKEPKLYKDPDEWALKMLTEKNSNKHIEPNVADAIIFRANDLFNNVADDPNKKAEATEALIELICHISSENLRNSYIEKIRKDLKLKSFTKQVKDLLEKKQKEKTEIDQKKSKDLDSTLSDEDLPDGIHKKNNAFYLHGTRISNFTMEIVYHSQTGNDKAYRLLSVKNNSGREKMILINTDDFVSAGRFKQILARNGDYVFLGNENQLTHLQEALQKKELGSIYLEQMGWNNKYKFYVFCDGIVSVDKNESSFLPIDKRGIVKYKGNNYFLPGMSEMSKEELFTGEKKFIYGTPVKDFGFPEWALLFFKTYKDNAKAAIPFYLASLFRDIIFEILDRFPILNLYGKYGSGKGTCAESLLYLFGKKQNSVNLESASKIGMQRTLAFASNALTILEEYKNNLRPEILGALKPIYDGQGRVTGLNTNDSQTHVTSIKQGVILCGEDMATTNQALYSRIIMLSFKNGNFSDGENLSKLKEMEHNGGFGYISADLLKHRFLIETNFAEAFRNIEKQIKIEVSNIDNRMIRNISILLAVVYLLKEKVALPFTYEECKDFLITNMKYQHSIIIGNDQTTRFWEIIESLSIQNIILYGREFIIENGCLYICLKYVLPWYLKELKQRGDPNGIQSTEQLRDYLKRDKSYVDFKKKRGFNLSGKNPWCDTFKYEELNIDLPQNNAPHSDTRTKNIQLEENNEKLENEVKQLKKKLSKLQNGKTELNFLKTV